MDYNFFAMMSRMKLIERWSLMRNSQSENISEHSLEVAMLAHGLTIISNERLGNNLNPDRAALIALYHDATEIITGDMPTPIKYFNKDIQDAFKNIENTAAEKLLDMLPEYMGKYYNSIFFPGEENEYLSKLIKAADKLSALIKCIEERKAGNTEFISAEKSITLIIKDMGLKEVDIFMEEFLPAYYKNLDELQ
ncbi:MAG: 5'-deoxynucleotidase [Clostridiales bacterium]|nr:5'-deoxynucleotidase [Clostridiales bacterium]